MTRTNDMVLPVVKRGSAHAKITETLRGWIRHGQWAKGECIPSERELAASLGVNRPLIHRAIVTLHNEGMLRRVGSQSRVANGSNELMEGSIVVIGNFGAWQASDSTHRTRAWVQFLEQGVVAAVSDFKHNAVTIHPERLNVGLVEQLIDARPCGVVVTECMSQVRQAARDRFAASKLPMAVYTGFERDSDYDRVYSDHEAGAYAITRWLLAQGRRRIAQVFGAESWQFWVQSRKAGYARAMREAGLEPLPAIDHPLINYPASLETAGDQFELSRHLYAGYLAPRLLCAEPLDALMAENDNQAYQLAAACRLLGCEPQRDIALAGHDNTYEDSPFKAYESCGPQVTADKRNLEMGFELIRLLMDRIEGRLPAEPQKRLVAPELIVVNEPAVV